jgi:predicted N-acyltransferase
MQIEVANTLHDIDAGHWYSINTDNNPFTSYAFLLGLEKTGCVGGRTGWLPRYLLARDTGHKLTAALPMYEKQHSWGEYVFDWAWANAWHQYGIEYYPKLVVAVPFSPVTGRRMLVSPAGRKNAVEKVLLKSAIDYAVEHGQSSIHFLFPTSVECNELKQQGLLIRHDVQFHWCNANYADFSSFLATLSSRKRKKIARERRRVAENGIQFRTVTGSALDEHHMDRMYRFYLSTIRDHGSSPYLNDDFFRHLAENLADNVVLIEAMLDGSVIAAAMNIRHEDTLYGRYWGCEEQFHSLHFETCYYQSIDYCINHGLSYFEGGAQGEHKLSRGFLPVITCSAHWMAEKNLTPAISNFLDREKQHVAHYQQLLNERSPYRKNS